MSSKYSQIDLNKVRTVQIANRQNKVRSTDFARLPAGDFSFANFMQSLPNQLTGIEFRQLVAALHAAKERHKPIIWMCGAHVIKVGLSLLLIELMRQGFITTLAMNGAGGIHDTELALGFGTSEDVAANLSDGSFGMAAETGEFFSHALRIAAQEALGFGEAIGREIIKKRPDALQISIFANAYDLNIPATLHVAIGTDIIHQQPGFDGREIGEASYRDFKILTNIITGLGDGGVVLNVGSAVIMPEVFLKALTIARNLGHPVTHFTTANFDMIQHYRPRVNVVQRPVLAGGQGYVFTGHHEIMIPLLAWALLSPTD